VKLFRQVSTRRLILFVASVTVIAAAAGAIAVTAFGGGGSTPPPKPLAQAIHDALTAPEPQGITARIKFTNNLFPSGALVGQAGSALMSGASGRVWITNDGRGRLELQSDSGDVQITWNSTEVNVYDASSNTDYRFTLPAESPTKSGQTKTPPTLDEITNYLTQLAQHASVSGAQPSNVAGQPAYTVSVSPKHDGGLLGSAQLAWDALQGVPLRAAIYAQGSSTPVLELKATDITYGPVSSSDVDISPPAGAKVVDVTPPASGSANGSKPGHVTGLDAVQKAVSFHIAAPDSLVGLPRQTVQLVGGSESKSKGVLVVYGQGLGAVVVFEHAVDASGNGNGMQTGALPPVSIDGVTGHELATQLGTVILFDRTGVSYVLAGSMPPAAAEAAARALK
jgi:hypothetical protein